MVISKEVITFFVAKTTVGTKNTKGRERTQKEEHMTKQQLIEENQKYRKALERILDTSSEEGTRYKQIVEKHSPEAVYPCIVGAVEVIAKYTLIDIDCNALTKSGGGETRLPSLR